MDAVGDQPRATASPSSSAAPTSPGSRLPSWLIALKRCVTIRAPASKAAARLGRGAVAVPEAHHRPGRRQRRDLRRRRRRRRQRHHQRRQPRRRGAAAASRSAAAIGRISAGSCAPLRRGSRCGPSRCSPRKPGTPAAAAAIPASITARVTAGVSVISVGSSPVVPSRACAAQIARDPRDAGRAVEHDPVAAIDLQVDEPRRQHAAVERDPSPPSGAASAGSDRRRRGPSSTTSAAPGMQRAAVEHRAAGENPPHHAVPRASCLRRVAGRGQGRRSRGALARRFALDAARLAAPTRWRRRLVLRAAASSGASPASPSWISSASLKPSRRGAGAPPTRRGERSRPTAARILRRAPGHPAAHTVSVTLRRCGGVSGSKPRRRASASMKR